MAGGFALASGAKASNLPPLTKTTWLLIALTVMAVMGGFLFGYDTGIVSGAMIIMRTRFALNDIWQELIVSATVGAAAVSSLAAGFVNNKYGRKRTILGSSMLFIIGAVILGAAPNKEVLLVGRIVLGFAIGLSSSTIPAYIAECSPPHVRGRMITMFQLMITFGFWIASLVAGGLSYIEDTNVNWRIMLGLAAVPGLIQLIGFFFMPESPRWLASHGQEDNAYEVMKKIYGGDRLAEQHAKFELELIREADEEAEKEKAEIGAEHQPSILVILRTPHLRKALIIGCSTQMFQQLSGINTVMYYSASIIMMSGVSDPTLAIWLAAVISGVNFLSTFIGIYLVEKIGRRLLLLCSIVGVFLCLIILGIAFALIAHQSPATRHVDQPVFPNGTKLADSHCAPRSCDECSYIEECGWCFDKSDPSNTGSCVRHFEEEGLMEDTTAWAMYGRCQKNTTATSKKVTFVHQSAVWYYGYCPTSLSWLPILGMVLYLCSFAAGYGPMPWAINAELFPNWARSAGTSLSTTTNWIFNLIISLTFLTLARAITRQGAYFLYAGITLIGLVWFYLVLPETKGKPIEELQALLMGPWITRGKAPQTSVFPATQEDELKERRWKTDQPLQDLDSFSKQDNPNNGQSYGSLSDKF